MELAFSTRLLRELCENEVRAKRALGARVGGKLKRRLADLRAAASVKDLVAGRPRELKSAHCAQIVIELCEGYCMVFGANHATVPVFESGGVNWSKVSRVKILGIKNDNG